MSIKYDFELFRYYSEILNTEYSAHYRSIENIKDKLGKKFILVDEQKIFNPELKKPETYQNLAIFKKIIWILLRLIWKYFFPFQLLFHESKNLREV